MEYPKDRLEIQGPRRLHRRNSAGRGRPSSARYGRSRPPHPIQSIATNRPWLQSRCPSDAGLNFARGEFVAIFDADFVSTHGTGSCRSSITSLSRKSEWFQTRWDPPQSQLQYPSLRFEAILLDGPLCHRTRRSLIAPATSSNFQRHRRHVGASRPSATAVGWQHDTLTEDTDLRLTVRSSAGMESFKIPAPCRNAPLKLPIEK